MIDPNIIVALISGLVTLLCTVLTVRSGTAKTQALIEKNQAVTDTKVEELTREVRIHNSFAQRIPVIEEKINNHETRLKELEGRNG